MVLNTTDVIVIVKTPIGTDDFGKPIYSETQETVSGCVVGHPSSTDVLNIQNMTGKLISYQILIPKEDNHIWENTDVIIDGVRYRTVGHLQKSFWIRNNLPCDKLISVMRYE